MADAESLVRSLSQHVENELERTGETMDYYRTLPVTANLLQPGACPPPRRRRRRPAAGRPPLLRPGEAVQDRPVRWRANAAPPTTFAARRASRRARRQRPPNPQEWLAGIFYPQKRIDGMFLTDATGQAHRRRAQARPAATSHTANSPPPRGRTPPPRNPARASSSRPSTRAPQTAAGRQRGRGRARSGGHAAGFSRLGHPRRAARPPAAAAWRWSTPSNQRPDSRSGTPARSSRTSLKPNLTGRDGIDPKLLHLLRNRKRAARRESGGRFYIFAAIDMTDWTLLLSRPALAVHAPVQEICCAKSLLLVGDHSSWARRSRPSCSARSTGGSF